MNLKPAITADSLCEYLTSPPTRRVALLERAKYPALHVYPFELARKIVVGFLLDGQDPAALLAQDETTGQRGIEAALRFAVSWASVAHPFDAAPSEPATIGVGSVRVTRASPDVLLTGTQGDPMRGGLALLFGHAGERMAQIRNALMARALGSADSLTTVVLGSRLVEHHGFAPIVQRDIEAACDEIARMWPTV